MHACRLGEGPPGFESSAALGPLVSAEPIVVSASSAAVKKGRGPLAPGRISIRRLEDANKHGISLCELKP